MKITVEDNGTIKSVDMYTQEGFDLVSELWLKLYTQNRLTHAISWLGIPIIQVAGDVIMMQELIWEQKPDIIVECGIAHGGSAIFYSSLFELMGKGEVIAVDIDIREHNRIAIQNHPQSNRIRFIEGSSIAEETVEKVKSLIPANSSVMVVLDSNHSKEHVAQELEFYKDLVTPGSYLVAMDGAQAFVADIPIGKPEWKDDNPLAAIDEFLKDNSDFEVNDHFTRLKVTANPRGFLKKLR